MTLDDDEDKLAAKTDDDAIIKECIERMALSVAADGENRKDALDDLAFVGGEQWDPMIRAQRERDQRPCLTVNKLPTFLHQVTNSQRQNVPSIKVHAVSDGDVKVAEVLQGGIRHVEYASNADVCYDTAVNSAAAIGFGYFRLVTDYAAPDSFDQEIRFKRIRNPFTVYMDPAHIDPDGSDQQWCILSVKMARTEFVAAYPKADVCSVEAIRGIGDSAIDWADADQLRIAEYYRIFNEPATVVQLSNGESGWKDKLLALPPGVTVLRERASQRPTVQWFKLNAVEVLARADIPCQWIPVFPVYGDEIDIDGRVKRSGLVRNAKDPARMYNYWVTSATEEISLRPKTPYIGAEGQFEGHEAEWAQANVRSFAVLEYKPKSLGGTLAPPPQRQPMADFPAGLMAMGRNANDDIKATTGIFDASLGAQSNETSGIAIQSRDKQGETSNYHFTDNLHLTLRHVGRCIVDMWPKVYDGARTLQILGEDKKMSSVKINTPIAPEEQRPDPKTGVIRKVLNDMSFGKYGVTVGVGPAYDTMRQEAVDGMLQTVKSWPKLMDIAGDKIIRSMDWPGAEEIADRIERTLPPELKDPEEDENGNPVETGPPPLPPEVQQQLEQQDAAMQDLMEQLDAAKSGVEKTQIQANASVEVARINAESRQDVEELRGTVNMLLARMTAEKEAAAAHVAAPAAAPAPSHPAPVTAPAAAAEPQEDIGALLHQMIATLQAPKRKQMSIRAPSGAVYQCEIDEESQQSSPTQESQP